MSTDRTEVDALLVRRATEGLRPDEEERLLRLLEENAHVDPEWVDRVIGEIDAASTEDAPPIDDLLRRRLEATAGQGGQGDTATPDVAPRRPSRRLGGWGWTGWAIAAGIGALWLTSGGPAVSGGATGEEAGLDPSAPGTVVANWAPGDDDTGVDVSGRVVWSSVTQTGVMELRGLAVNAPDQFQYQLWIFDRERDERYPVDGGVFDMPAGAEEAQVAIAAKLQVDDPTLFAVTVERPGGVVVSDRSRIAIVAQVLE